MDPHEARWLSANLNLGDDWIVYDKTYQTLPLVLNVYVAFIGEIKCPICGQKCPKYDTRERRWRDLNYGHATCYVVARIPRVRCKTCGIHEIEVSWAGQASKLTLTMEQAIVSKVRHTPMSLVAKEFKLFSTTVSNIAKHYSDQLMQSLDLRDMTVFCLDETSSQKGHNYISNFIDPFSGAVVFATHGKDSSVLTEFKVWLVHHNGDPKNIRAVCCDMSTAFVTGITREFPDATIVFDPFHIISAATSMLEAVRKEAGFKGKDGKGLRFGFLMNKEDLAAKPEYESRVKGVLNSYEDLGCAYGIKEAMRDFYDIENIVLAEVYLRALQKYCQKSEVKAIAAFGDMVMRHFDGILAWHHVRISNGYCEGTNSVIQAMKCSARGYRNIENMISLIYLRSSVKHPSLKGALNLNGI